MLYLLDVSFKGSNAHFGIEIPETDGAVVEVERTVQLALSRFTVLTHSVYPRRDKIDLCVRYQILTVVSIEPKAIKLVFGSKCSVIQ